MKIRATDCVDLQKKKTEYVLVVVEVELHCVSQKTEP